MATHLILTERARKSWMWRVTPAAKPSCRLAALAVSSLDERFFVMESALSPPTRPPGGAAGSSAWDAEKWAASQAALRCARPSVASLASAPR